VQASGFGDRLVEDRDRVVGAAGANERVARGDGEAEGAATVAGAAIRGKGGLVMRERRGGISEKRARIA
jgi:hypothetical protein